ncbi:MAG TPA: MFS transporter [Dehalococcoidia bacterium]|jgi:MFS family permease|nr:MFS transporter [Dehalococcoidia bacterium]
MIRRVFPILAVSIFACMLGAGIVIPLLPLYAESLGASGFWLGAIFAGFAISRTIATPIFGHLSDRTGRKPFIVIGLFFYGVIALGFIWADSVPLLVMIRLLHGVAGGLILPIAQAYIGDISPEGEEGKWMGYANAAFFSGYGFGPLMGGVLTEQLGMNSAFLAMGGLSLLAFGIAALFLPEISRRKLAARPHLSWREMGRSGTMTGLFSFRLALTLGRAAFFTFLPILATTSLGLSPSLVGVLLAVYLLLSSLLGVPFGRLADRVSRRAMVVIGSLASFSYLTLIPLAGNFWQLVMLCILGSLGSAASVAAASALTVEEGRKYGMGSAIAMFSMALSIGMAVGPLLGGAIADLADINSVFYFGAMVMLAGTVSFGWLTRSG